MKITTLEQSKKLAELGVLQIACYSFVKERKRDEFYIALHNVETVRLIEKDKECYSAFSIDELLTMLPDGMTISKDGHNYTAIYYGYTKVGDNVSVICAEFIIWAIEKDGLPVDDINSRLLEYKKMMNEDTSR